MSMRSIKKGSTDQSVVIRIIDSTDGTPETSVVYNTSGIDLWYRREGATKTSITEATLTNLNDAHSDGGVLHIGDGYYRLDLPDAAVATGANGVMVGGTVTGMIVIGCYVPLVDHDPYDGVRLGLTALPNAAADAAGGLPISDAGGLDLDAKLANTNEITAARMGALTDWIDGGRLDLLQDAIKTKTDSLTFTVAGDVDCNVQSWGGAAAPAMTGDAYARLGAPAGASVSADIAAVKTQTAAIETDTQDLQTQVGTAGAGLTAVPWNAAWDAQVQSEVFDALDAEITDATSLTANGLLDRLRAVMWILRNKIEVADGSGTTKIYKDDSTTVAFQSPDGIVNMLTDNSTTTTRLRAA